MNSLVWKDEKISFLRFSGDQILAVTKNLRIGAKGGIIGALKSIVIFPIFLLTWNPQLPIFFRFLDAFS
ncbi:MAG: hypothetical protein KA436_12040 [Oligoflexales bacterium]|nr:hypothetical protein [Oligoflexales bacterium]